MMAKVVLERDPGSFRDPGGYVFVGTDSVWRSVNERAAEDFKIVHASGILKEFEQDGLILSTTVESAPGDLKGARGEIAALWLRQPRIPLVTYPYEWTFSQLQDAALAHLRLQIRALERGFVLSDSSAYNMAFLPEGPRHFDILSLRPYRLGEIWNGYHQFCQHFLFPLLMEAWAGLPFQGLLKGQINGIEVGQIAKILPRRRRYLSPNAFLHVTLQDRASRKSSSNQRAGDVAEQPSLSIGRYRLLITEMRDFVASLKRGSGRPSYWAQYAQRNSYSDEMQSVKRRFVAECVERNKSEVVWDLGGNSGDYAQAALSAGATSAVVLDSDVDALEVGYQARKDKKIDLLPFVVDCGDPSPNRGWRQRERKGLGERANADTVLALALVHHLAIGRNIPLTDVVAWIVSLGANGVIEFVPKGDPMVAGLLRFREDVFHDYTEERFLQALSELANVRALHRFEENGRILVSFSRY